MKVTVVNLDVPNHNGNVYPREVMEKAVAQYKKTVDKGKAFVTSRMGSNSVNPSVFVGKVTDICVQGDRVVVDVDFFSTTKGVATQEAVEKGTSSIYTTGAGSVTHKDGVKTVNPGYQLHGFIAATTIRD